MASAMATAATRNIPPPYAIPVGPRVRPPRLLPGTKADNTNPRPDASPPTPGHVWVQGKWRNPSSRAAEDRRNVESKRAEKALRHLTHGTNIYAYSHIRTNQVVYSLTKVMNNTKILAQLQYYGKQTVPSSLRRDVWRPYFSIHFPENPVGAETGLKAYRRLRELATLRQLSPPPELVIATREDVEKARRKYDPQELKDRLDSPDHKIKGIPIKNMPTENELLPRQLRAKKLMDQKASSVADAAYVLGLVNDADPRAEHDANLRKQMTKLENMSSRAKRRLGKIRTKEAAKDIEIDTRQETAQPTVGDIGLTPHVAKRIALEHGGLVSNQLKGVENMVNGLKAIKQQTDAAKSRPSISGSSCNPHTGYRGAIADFDADTYRTQFIQQWQAQNGTTDMHPSTAEVEAAVNYKIEQLESQSALYNQRDTEPTALDVGDQQNDNRTARTVHVLWADMRDATWAKQWSSNVYHGELEARAVIKREISMPNNKAFIDQEGNEVTGPVQKVIVQSMSTPHVFGSASQGSSRATQSEASEEALKLRNDEFEKWQQTKSSNPVMAFRHFESLRLRKAQLEGMLEKLEQETELLSKGKSSSSKSRVQSLAQVRKRELRAQIAPIDRQLQEIRRRYSNIAEMAAELRKEFTQLHMEEQLYVRLVEFQNTVDLSLEQYTHQVQATLESLADDATRVFTNDTDLKDLKDLPKQRTKLDKKIAGANGRIIQYNTKFEKFAGDFEQQLSFREAASDSEATLGNGTEAKLNQSPENRMASIRSRYEALKESAANSTDTSTTPSADSLRSGFDRVANVWTQIENDRALIQRIITEEGLSKSAQATRTNMVREAIETIKTFNEAHSGIFELLDEQVAAEARGDIKQVEAIKAKVIARENELIAQRLNFSSAPPSTEPQQSVRDFEEIEIEAPTKEPSVWARVVKGLFGR